MSYYEQTLGSFYTARRDASGLLIAKGAIKKVLRVDEALVLQAASHITSQSQRFNEPQVVALTDLPRTTVYGILFRFIDIGVTEIVERQGGPGRPGMPMKVFEPTELGSEVFDFFSTPELS